MEKAVLKTLIYANIFLFPMKAYEIHKWLIGKQATFWQVEKALTRLFKKRKIGNSGDFYFLKNHKQLVLKRKRREKQSEIYFKKAKIFGQFLKIIPWVKLVGISGGLALENSEKRDDIDLFLITDKNRLWLSRMLVIFILDFFGVRRKVGMSFKDARGKFCLNTILDEDHLEQLFKDLYTAHEVLQMKLLWQREGIYTKYLSDNSWAFKFLPNWIGEKTQISKRKSQTYKSNLKTFDLLEKIARWIQLKIMKKPEGMERIQEGALYLHPLDIRPNILKLYKQKISRA
ncbi:hypothetical protein HYS92_00935 [Candidatus Daviesbacteria bacterium]|nr:hypothetical protein [Candidatus Daviesbacteria bacterium]